MQDALGLCRPQAAETGRNRVADWVARTASVNKTLPVTRPGASYSVQPLSTLENGQLHPAFPVILIVDLHFSPSARAAQGALFAMSMRIHGIMRWRRFAGS